PNSVTIFDYGKTEDDIYFMAMEYLEGQTLHMALREGGVMSEARTGHIAAQICRALREAHKLGVIHRDLKPANIFLTRPSAPLVDASSSFPPLSEEEDADFVKVLDFGLVKHLSERPEEQLTQTGLFMGSPKYMAPEQIQGGVVDERTDIYSLGIIMYEMLAGKVPFERATSVNILMAHVGEAPPPMRSVNPNLVCSSAFEELVMSCIAKDPNSRLSSMDHVLQAIRRALGGSLTGQFAAVSVSVPSVSPPASVPPGSVPPVPSSPTVSAMQSSMGLSRAPASNDVTSSTVATKGRPSMEIALGVLAAALLGGGLGLLAFRWTAPVATASVPAPAVSTAATAALGSMPAATPPAPTSAAPAETLPVEARRATFDVTTEPPGASVRENGKEICVATPCALVFQGEAADPSKVHKLIFLHPGFRPEVRFARVSDPPLRVKLAHPIVSVVRPAAPSSKPETTTPAGFKDQPY
ncbi:MAG TPA: serine/threonine-protein kinase, partial [Labilithrix sp.]|nr:serine/threonine-protein kinase [Labilithrix sp.]